MKKRMLATIILLVGVFGLASMDAEAKSSAVKISYKNFPDSSFQSYIEAEFDKNGDGKLGKKELASVKTIDVGEYSDMQLEGEFSGPSSIKGVEFFPNVTYIDCSNCRLTKLDVSKNKKLKRLVCYGNSLTKLDVTKNKEMDYLNCSNNKLKKLDVRKNTKLNMLDCFSNKLKQLQLGKNKRMTSLDCSFNKIKSLNVKSMPKLKEFYCSGNALTKLDITKNKNLQKIFCNDNKIKSLNTKNNKKLFNLACDNNKLTSLNLKNNKKLQILACEKNQIVTGNCKISSSQIETLTTSKQKKTIQVKKVNGQYLVPLDGITKTNAIKELSAGRVTSKGILLSGNKIPNEITYQYNMFTDGTHMTKVVLKLKK